MKDREDYSKIFENRKKKEVTLIFFPFSSTRFIDREFKFTGRILDFGSSIKSPNFEKTMRDGGKYFGFDIDKQSTEWLKQNNFFVDFWKTKEKFDAIIASQVFEHLSVEEREAFVKKSSELLDSGGLLILEYPYIQNLGGMGFWKDRTHTTPPALEDEAVFMELFGFEAKPYLVGISYWPLQSFLRLVLNILIGYHPQHSVVIIGRKKMTMLDTKQKNQA